MSENDQIQAAATGDGNAFGALTEPLLPEITEYVYRVVAHPDDCADVVQETLVAAFAQLESYPPGVAFRSFLLAVATEEISRHLENKPHWSPASYAAAMDEASGTESDRDAIGAELASVAFRLDVREHIAFCLTCVTRSLSTHEACAIHIPEPSALGQMSQALQASAGDTLSDIFEDLCALQNPEGTCSLCKDLFNGVAPEQRTGKLIDITDWEHRMAIASAVTLSEAVGRPLHDLLYRGIDRRERDPRSREA